jgi:hypothetical protein
MVAYPSGAKARVFHQQSTARLKPCPFKANQLLFNAKTCISKVNGFGGGMFAQLAGARG